MQIFPPKRFGGTQFGYWAVTERETDTFLGQVHLDPYVNAGWFDLAEDGPAPFQTLEVHLGFAFGRQFWGRGYAAEACQAAIRYAFTHLRLRRLVGGASLDNDRSVRLHQRLGFRLIVNEEDRGVTAILENPLMDYHFRAYRESDRSAAGALGTHVIDGWHAKGPEASLHLVAECAATGEIAGHLQAMDCSVPAPSRRPGQCHFFLDVAAAHRRRGIGAELCRRAEAFARQRKARLLYTETSDPNAAPFLTARGFAELERFFPSHIDLNAFDPARFADALGRVTAQGFRLTTYAGMGDSPQNRRSLHALEQIARASQPFREVKAYVPIPFAKWEQEFAAWNPETIFLALAPSEPVWAGVVTGLEWYFTGVHPHWRGRGIATALKVLCLAEAKKRKMERMETENHEDNAAMLAVNRKLGFTFTAPGIAYCKHF